MKKVIIILSLFFFCVLCFSKIAAQPKEMYGVFVGMKNYQYPPINPILNSQMTANMIKSRLVLFQNWKDSNMNLLYDPDKEGIRLAVAAMPKNSSTLNFFYYVGHGTTDGMVMLNQAYQDYNTIPKINPSELQSYFGSFNDYCAFIDACNSGIFANQMTTGIIGTSAAANETAWGGSIFNYTPFGGALGDGISTYQNPIPIGMLTAEGLFAFAEPRARSISGNNPQLRDNYSGNLLITTPAYNVSATNSFVGLSYNGTMKVDDVSQSMPYTIRKYYGSTVKLQAENHSVNYIEYNFDHWQDGNTISTRTISSLTSDMSFTAYFKGKPTNTCDSIRFGNIVGSPIVVYWKDNPNTSVTQYQIWRIVKHNGVTGPETLIATVGRGVQSYTDYDYLLTSTYSDDLLHYDVRAFYSTEGTYSDTDYKAVYGKESLVKMNESKTNQEQSLANEIPIEYSIGNFPNPFNPTTTIKYQLPEAGFVTLKVYDILGREIAQLVNENRPAGYYEVNFNASKLTSGVYIYTIQAGKYTESKKMILAK